MVRCGRPGALLDSATTIGWPLYHKLDLANTQIVAPEAGRIARKNVELRGFVQVGQPLMALVTHSVDNRGRYLMDNRERYLSHLFHSSPFADQKQLARSAFDNEILSRARRHLGIEAAAVCHPSTMFQLLRQFCLGNDSLQSVLEYTQYEPIRPAGRVDLPTLPDRFVAVKLYTGRALTDTPAHREQLRRLVDRRHQYTPALSILKL